MSSRSRTSSSRNPERIIRTTMWGRGGLPSMSEKQTQAYLIARDVLRRIRRTCSLVMPPPDEDQGVSHRVRAGTRPDGSYS
jgi:hypothetical protein